jgi:hypothetical protein
MKKAKIMLMAIAVLAIVGGALAFKATQKFPYGVCDTVNGFCSLHQVSLNLTTVPSGGTITTVAPPTQPCSAINTVCTTRVIAFQ